MAVLGSNLETQEIKRHFWVRTQDFQTSILFPVFNSKVQVWLLSSLPAWCSFSWLLLRNLNSILGLFAYLHSNCKLLSRAQTQTLKQTFTWVQTQENFWVSNQKTAIFWFTLTGPFSRPCHSISFICTEGVSQIRTEAIPRIA